MEHDPRKISRGWLEALAKSRDEAQRGDTVSVEVVFEEIRQMVAEMEV